MPTLRFMPDRDNLSAGVWRDYRFGVGQAITVRSEALLTDLPKGFVVERTPQERTANISALKGRVTSSTVASSASKLMRHDDPEVRKVAASALVQKG